MKTSKFIFSALAAALCLVTTACSNPGTVWDRYSMASNEADANIGIIYPIKD